MPDWTYRTLVRPVATTPARHQRVLSTFGRLGRLPFGPRLIAWFGHGPRINRPATALDEPSPQDAVGVSLLPCDTAAVASRALAGLAASFVDAGDLAAPHARERLADLQVLRPDVVVLGRASTFSQDGPPTAHVDLLEVQADHVAEAVLAVPADVTVVSSVDADESDPDLVAGVALAAGAQGLVVRGRYVDALRCLERLRLLDDVPVIACTDVADVPGALALLDAGATRVAIGAGLGTSGPALPGRVREALIDRAAPPPVRSHALDGFTLDPRRWAGWVWVALLGAAMVVGGLAAAAITLGPVLLPYDAAYLGTDVEGLEAINPLMVEFLQHDRITLSGTMVSIGLLYSGMAWGGMRAGRGWARQAVAAVSLVGFPTFLLFLGFGFFDPLHGAFAAVLGPLAVLGHVRPRSARRPGSWEGPDDRARNRAVVGQLLVIMLGAGLLVGGATIAIVGIGNVFVPADLHYLQADRHLLHAANDQLLSFTAHDRAGFGGALVSDAVGVVLLGMWGFQRGQRWVWWTLLLSGSAGFVPATVIHLSVGYTDVLHLAPVGVGFAFLVVALWLSAPYLLSRRPSEP